jgi:hypothetical protein
MDKETTQIVTNVRNADPRLEQIVNELENSPYPFQIQANLSGNAEKGSFSPGVIDPTNPQRVVAARLLKEENRYNGKGMGGHIQTVSKTGADGKTPEQTMAHELGHAFDCNRGITPTRSQKEIGIIGKSVPLSKLIDIDENENRAVRTENIYNLKKGKPMRDKYPVTGENRRSKEEVPNPGPEFAPVTTEPKDKAPHLRDPALTNTSKKDGPK